MVLIILPYFVYFLSVTQMPHLWLNAISCVTSCVLVYSISWFHIPDSGRVPQEQEFPVGILFWQEFRCSAHFKKVR